MAHSPRAPVRSAAPALGAVAEPRLARETPGEVDFGAQGLVESQGVRGLLLMEEALAAHPFVKLARIQQRHDARLVGALTVVAPDGSFIDARQALRALDMGQALASGDPRARAASQTFMGGRGAAAAASFGPIGAAALQAALDGFEPAFALLIPLLESRRSPSVSATGPDAPGIARQMGLPDLGARMEGQRLAAAVGEHRDAPPRRPRGSL